MAIELPGPGPLLGPFLLGTTISSIFFGILCGQCTIFFNKSYETSRGRASKYLIGSIWILNTLHLFCSIWSSYLFMVTNFSSGIARMLGAIPWSFAAIFVVTALSNGLVQGWFVWHIWIYSSKNRIVTTVLGVGVICTFCSVIALAGKGVTVKDFQFLRTISWLFYTSLALDACTNLCITGALSVYMGRARRSPLYRWDFLISTPVIFMSHTGIFCFIEIFLTLLFNIIRPNDFIFFGIFIPYSTAYANALLGFLNSGIMLDDPRPRPSHPLRNLHNPVAAGSQHAIHTDIQRAMDMGRESPAISEVPVTVHVEMVIEKDKVLV